MKKAIAARSRRHHTHDGSHSHSSDGNIKESSNGNDNNDNNEYEFGSVSMTRADSRRIMDIILKLDCDHIPSILTALATLRYQLLFDYPAEALLDHASLPRVS